MLLHLWYIYGKILARKWREETQALTAHTAFCNTLVCKRGAPSIRMTLSSTRQFKTGNESSEERDAVKDARPDHRGAWPGRSETSNHSLSHELGSE